jgi:hypothetical protein
VRLKFREKKYFRPLAPAVARTRAGRAALGGAETGARRWMSAPKSHRFDLGPGLRRTGYHDNARGRDAMPGGVLLSSLLAVGGAFDGHGNHRGRAPRVLI